MNNNKLFTTKNLVLMAVFAALGAVLMYFEFPLTFLAPGFYELDLSEIPILIGSFIMGPLSAIIMEAVKILIKIVIKPTSTGYVGELANFCVGCCLVVPAGLIYRLKKTRKNAFIGMLAGTVFMAIAGAVLNYYVMLPFYEQFMSINDIIAAGAKIWPVVNSKFRFVTFCVAPFNVAKGIIVSLVTAVIYKKISLFIKGIGNK